MSKYFNVDSSGNLDLSFVNEKQNDIFYVKIIQPCGFWFYLQEHKKLRSLTVNIDVIQLCENKEITFLSISAQNFPFLKSCRKIFKFFNIVVTCENYHV